MTGSLFDPLDGSYPPEANPLETGWHSAKALGVICQMTSPQCSDSIIVGWWHGNGGAYIFMCAHHTDDALRRHFEPTPASAILWKCLRERAFEDGREEWIGSRFSPNPNERNTVENPTWLDSPHWPVTERDGSDAVPVRPV